jgi:coenzyme F420-reducing hydrogenase alpha subunit
VAEFFKKLNYPKYERKVELVGLVGKDEYAFYKGEIRTSSKERKINIKNFYKELAERQTDYDPTKRVKHKGKDFMVGAIARLNLSHGSLNSEAKKLLDFFGSKKTKDGLVTKNTFHNIYAQAVELVHCIEEITKLLDEYFEDRSKIFLVKHRMKNGEGLAATEAPRGTLYHYYKVDRYGIIRECNIIPPTAQFLDSLENDLEKYLSETEIKNDEDRKRKINMMVRAYDPCMTCATH